MNHLFLEVLTKFKNKGLAPFEIIDLVKDVALLNRTNQNYTLDVINEELETLGWGIQIMDQSLYEDLTILIDRAHLTSFKVFIAKENSY